MDADAVIAIRARVHGGDPATDRIVWMWCPGCESLHCVVLDTAAAWTWDGDERHPTFSPSILVTGGSQALVCHSFVRAGVWDFLADSTHPLAGQQVPMVPFPAWVQEAFA